MDDLIEAARTVVYQRDYFAEHGGYDPLRSHPELDQCFDDWAADLLETVLP